MNNVIPAQPRKTMTPAERNFLKQANRLLLDNQNGRIASAALVDIIADWHGCRGPLPFGDYAKRWVAEGNAKNKHADALLRALFGLDNDPTPRRAA